MRINRKSRRKEHRIIRAFSKPVPRPPGQAKSKTVEISLPRENSKKCGRSDTELLHGLKASVGRSFGSVRRWGGEVVI
jgi:hypothetical protein